MDGLKKFALCLVIIFLCACDGYAAWLLFTEARPTIWFVAAAHIGLVALFVAMLRRFQSIDDREDLNFIYIAAAHVALIAFSLWRMTRRRAKEAKTPHRYMPRTSFTLGRLFKQQR